MCGIDLLWQPQAMVALISPGNKNDRETLAGPFSPFTLCSKLGQPYFVVLLLNGKALQQKHLLGFAGRI